MKTLKQDSHKINFLKGNFWEQFFMSIKTIKMKHFSFKKSKGGIKHLKNLTLLKQVMSSGVKNFFSRNMYLLLMLLGIQLWWWWFVFVNLTDDKGLVLFQPRPLPEILTIVNLQHVTSRIWTCAEPDIRLCWIKLGSSYND